MPEHIRALVVVFALSVAVLFVARPAMIQVVPATTFDRWRKLWLFTTLAWFLAGNIWIYVVLMVLVLTQARKKEPYIFALYLLLLFAAPSAPVPIPGFGVIDHVIVLDQYRLLSLTLLLPVALQLKRNRETLRFGQSPVDVLLAGYLILTWIVNVPETTVTNGIRMGVLQVIDAFLPYYVASRSIRSIEDFRVTLGALLLGALMLCVLGAFEVLRSWKLYTASIMEYGLPVSQMYKARGPFLRPGAALQDSIVLGMVVVVGIGAMLYLKDLIAGKLRKLLLSVILVMGLLASLSRAPWMAGILIYILFYIQHGSGLGKLAKGFVAFCFMIIVLSFFPIGKLIFDLLPFIGQTEQGSIDYRMSWFSASMPLIERNFWFGDVKVAGAPELEVMRQGEGIIDLVNMFLIVLLQYGAIGFLLFFGMFFLSLSIVRRTETGFRQKFADLSRMGRFLIAAVVSIMFIIFTLSPISVVPIMIWSFLGLCASYGFLGMTSRRKDIIGKSPLTSV